MDISQLLASFVDDTPSIVGLMTRQMLCPREGSNNNELAFGYECGLRPMNDSVTVMKATDNRMCADYRTSIPIF